MTTLSLIGAAFPRTGTMTIKKALEILGVGNSYHMHEIFLNPSHATQWKQAIHLKNHDWETLLKGYTSTLDAPACLYWKQLQQTYPKAKILLVERESQSWYESMLATVYPVLIDPSNNKNPVIQMAKHLFLEEFMEGKFSDRIYAIKKFEDYCAEVKSQVPPEKLLVYRVDQGWEPLCEFLGREKPDIPFPIKNQRKAFAERKL